MALLGNQHEALDRLERATVFVLNSGLQLEAALDLICMKCGTLSTRTQHKKGCPKEDL